MVYEGDFGSLRVRVTPLGTGGEPCVRSWTLAFRPPAPTTLEAACKALGIRPADEVAPPPRSSTLLRRPLPNLATGEIHSLTAVRREGAIRSVTAFDEPPDWEPGALST